MRHIDPKDSSVMREFERLAVEKGWVVRAALEAGMADQLRKGVNAVAELLPKTNAVLDLLVPLAETGGDSTDLRHALDALRASVMDPWLAKSFDEQGGEARSLYHTARSMLHAPEGQGHMWLEGLRGLRELLTRHWGQTVERSQAVPQVTDEEMPPGMADDGQAAEDPEWLRPGPDVLRKREERARQEMEARWFMAPVVGRVQTVLQGLGFDIGSTHPDNVWGPRTNQAWNEFVRQYGLDQRYGLAVMPEIHPGDRSSPPAKDMDFVAEHGAALSVIEEPKQKSPAAADDGALAQKAAAVMGDLLSLANDLDDMGAHKAAAAVDEQLRMYKKAADSLYDITGETGEQLIDIAHPGGGPTMVPAQDEGGKVETIVEEHKKVREKATKPPTGKQAAFVAQQLASLANRLDGEGKKEAAMLVDKTLDELRRASRLPFAGSLRSEAQNAISAADLSGMLNAMADDMDVIAASVQDQSDFPSPIATAIEKRAPVRWGSRNYGAEFDEFVEEAQSWLRDQSTNAASVVGDSAMLAELLRQMGFLAAGLIQVRAIYGSLDPRALAGSWSPQAERAFQDYMKRLGRFRQESGVAKPREEAAKMPEKAPAKSEQGGIEWRRLQQTVGTIIANIERAQKEDRHLLDAAFKNARIPGISGQDGIEKALKVLSLVRKLKGSRFDDVKAHRYNNWLWNHVVSLLRQATLLKGASQATPLSKRAAEEAPPGFGEAKSVRTPRGRAPAKKRADVEALQALLDRLGYALGSAGVDGIWGQHTAAAWEQLRKDVLAMNGPALPPAAPAKSRGPAPNAVRTAVQLAAYLLRIKGEAGKAVNLGPGIKVSENAMNSPEAFLRALARIPASGVRIADPGDVFGKENLAAAMGLLNKYREELFRPGSPETWSIWTKGGGEEGLRGRVRLVDSLLAQLRTAGSRVPPSGYGYEGSSLPFGTLEGGPGRTSTGREPAGRAPTSQRQQRFSPRGDPRAVYATYQRLLPKDLMDAMTDTRQFIWYANNIWPNGVTMRNQGTDRRKVTMAYLTYLRGTLGWLRQRMTPAMMRQLGSYGQKIIDDIMQAVSYMATLEDDIRYGSL